VIKFSTRILHTELARS